MSNGWRTARGQGNGQIGDLGGDVRRAMMTVMLDRSQMQVQSRGAGAT